MDVAEHELAVKAQIGFVTGSAAYYSRKRLGQLTAATRRFYPNWDEARYQDCLRRFALDEGKRVSELSEGMKVKYQLALAMSHHAKLLILDEPTSGLDPAAPGRPAGAVSGAGGAGRRVGAVFNAHHV